MRSVCANLWTAAVAAPPHVAMSPPGSRYASFPPEQPPRSPPPPLPPRASPVVIMGSKGEAPQFFIPPAPPSRGISRTAVVMGAKSGGPEAPLLSASLDPGDDCPLGNVPLAKNRRRLGKKDPTGSCALGCDPDGDGKVYSVGGTYMGTVAEVCPCTLTPCRGQATRRSERCQPPSPALLSNTSRSLTHIVRDPPRAQGGADANTTVTTAT